MYYLRFIAFLAIIISCTETTLTMVYSVQANAEAFIIEKLNDPDSYQFIKIELIDSVSYAGNLEKRKEMFSNYLSRSVEGLERMERYKVNFPDHYDDEEVHQLESNKLENEVVLSGLDSLATNMRSTINDVASYLFLNGFRSLNSFGATVLGEYLIQAGPSPDFEILTLTDNPKEQLVTPGGIPGYSKLLRKNQGEVLMFIENPIKLKEQRSL